MGILNIYKRVSKLEKSEEWFAERVSRCIRIDEEHSKRIDEAFSKLSSIEKLIGETNKKVDEFLDLYDAIDERTSDATYAIEDIERESEMLGDHVQGLIDDVDFVNSEIANPDCFVANGIIGIFENQDEHEETIQLLRNFLQSLIPYPHMPVNDLGAEETYPHKPAS